MDCQFIEVIGHSPISFADAVRQLVYAATEEGRKVRAVDVVHQTVKVTYHTNKDHMYLVFDFRVDAKIVFEEKETR